MRQIGFSFLKDYKKEFGGSLLQGRRKSRRPLSTKSPIHLILKTDGRKIFNPRLRQIEKLIRNECAKYHIKIYDLALNWDHIHALILLRSRENYVCFIRSITSKLSQWATCILKSRVQLNKKSKIGALPLFQFRPYSKIVSWGRQLKNVLRYQTINKYESEFGSYARRQFEQNKQTIMIV